MKTCTKCKIEKPKTEFHKSSTTKDGLYSSCAKCKTQSVKDRYWKDPEKYKEKSIKRRIENPERVREIGRESDRKRQDAKSAYTKQYAKDNREKVLAIKRAYNSRNNDRINEARRASRAEKFKNDHIAHMSHRIRGLVTTALRAKGKKKSSRTEEILGCTIEQFIVHLEKQFCKGMSWENRRKWHIDHILPMASAKTEEDVIKLNHFTNLRPLWAKDNLEKRDKILTLI